ncbi:LLM class flavin-dependent oxidoreductase [Haloarchaeobius sp. HRN-SO-5]|uniref:LLM class flavin-dependent oxidoreductase n=1 Tax=Haloarchaeobius sp. HRN-SO-5 TaxID=3446118 RepID=UPI003EBA6D96
MDMDLGAFVTPYFRGDVPASENAEALVGRAELATELDYEYVEVGDHHVTSDDQFFQNVPTAGRLAAEVDHLAVLFLLPMYHPLYVAEYLGTLGAFTDRLDFWCAVGGNPDSFDALDIPLSDRAGRIEEALAVVTRLLDGDPVSFDGDHFSLDETTISPTADPRICIGGLARPAVERAGRLGDAWVVHPSERVDDLRRKRGWFEDAGGDTVIVRRDALVLEDGDEARERVESMLRAGYRGWPEDAEYPLVGDAEDVAADLEALQEAGADEVVVGAMDHETAAETFREVAAARERL